MIGDMVEYGNGVSQVSGQAGGGGGGGGQTVDVGASVVHSIGHTVDQIAFQLAASYSAPRELILADILPLLQELADKGVVRA